MNSCRFTLVLLACLPGLAQSRVDPKILSIHPFAGQRGTTFTATVRGSGLTGATSVVAAAAAPMEITVETTQPEPPEATGGRGKAAINLVTLRVKIRDDAQPGRYPIRLIANGGLSNALSIHVVGLPVSPEPAGAHDTPESAIAVTAVPVAFAGRLARRGEADFYAFHGEAGQTVTFEAISGLPQIAAGGSAATIANFDPALSLYESGTSWFDPQRLKRIAYNDEPMWVMGSPTDAHLVHRFAKSGDYLLRIEAFAGQGGPDYSYQLKIASGSVPPDTAKPAASGWDERIYTRRLDADRLNQLAARGGKPATAKSIETYRAAAEPTSFKLPGTLEGALALPGETHRARFHLDAPGDLAIEIETPGAAPPFFNPIVRLLNAAGEEVATNVFVGRGACSGAMTKSLQAKTVVPLREIGDYIVEIREAASDLTSPRFVYRVQVRPQVPHVGRVRIDTDVVNLTPGEAKTIRVMFDREEDYRGAISIAVDSLPPGVSASVGADYEPDSDPPSTEGKRERYTPRTERAVIILSAAPGTPPLALPHEVRVTTRPLVDGKLGAEIMKKMLPVMVVAKP